MIEIDAVGDAADFAVDCVVVVVVVDCVVVG